MRADTGMEKQYTTRISKKEGKKVTLPTLLISPNSYAKETPMRDVNGAKMKNQIEVINN